MIYEYDLVHQRERGFSIPSSEGEQLSTFAISPDGKKLVLVQNSSNLEQHLYIYDIDSETVLDTLQLNNFVRSITNDICFASDPNKVVLLYCAQSCGVSVLDLSAFESRLYEDFLFGTSVDCFTGEDAIAIEVAPSLSGYMAPFCDTSQCNLPDGIYKFDLGDEDLMPLVLDEKFDRIVTHPSISNDGMYLLFQIGHKIDDPTIGIMNLSTKEVDILTTGYLPAWRP